jgi:hypothetical protein
MPAKRNGLQYFEGTLTESEGARLEEHYFSCPVCLNIMRTLQTAAEEFALMPVVSVPAKRWSLPGWPVLVWSTAAVGAMLLIGIFAFRNFEPRPSQPAVVLNQRTPSIQPAAPPPPEPVPPASHASLVRPSELADLTLPVSLIPTLRGEKQDVRFLEGMKEYAKGNCDGAVKALLKVPAEDAEARTAAFYAGACRMHLGDYASASALLHKVADVENAPRQEAALYLLAQVALAENDPAAAHVYLERVLSLRGDLESKARAEQRRIDLLIGQGQPALGTVLKTK